ncbi:MAG: RAD55 family ATPase [Candidatus Nanohaloarchaea archaeon]
MGNDRVSTGIEGLDEKINGGFPANTTIILMGEEGSGKGKIVKEFIYQGLKNDEQGMYVTLDDTPDSIKDDAEYYGWDYTEYEDNMVFLDGYSWQAGGSDHKYALEGLSDLNQMNMTFTDALNGLDDGQKRVVLDSASTLLLYTDPSSAVKFLQVVGAKSTGEGGCLIITLEEGMHDDQTINTVNHVADGVIKTRVQDNSNQMKIKRLDKTDFNREWWDIEIDSDEGKISIKD